MFPNIGKPHLKHPIEHFIRAGGKTGLAVEIGGWTGGTSVVLSEYFDKVIVIDPFVSGWDEDDICSRADMNEIYQEFMKNTGDRKNIVLYREPSVVAVDRIGDKTIDFLFVDGDHRKDTVRAEIAAFLPKMRDGWRIIFHDMHLPGVSEAVNEYFWSGVRFDGNAHIVSQQDTAK